MHITERAVCMGLIFAATCSVHAQEVPRSAEGLPLVHWQEADRFYYQEAVVYGRVVLATNIGSMVFLNFHEDFRNHFTVVIRQESFGNFPEPPERLYHNKYIAVRGLIERYQNKPEIIITSPKQVMILSADTVDPVAELKKRIPGRAEVGEPAQARPSLNRLTVATVNLDGVLTPHDPLCRSDIETPALTPRQSTAVDLIKDLNADVLAIQHAGTKQCLESFNETFLAEMGYQHVIGFEHPDRGALNSALLSRLPVMDSRSLTHFDTKQGKTRSYKYPPLRVDLRLPSGSMLTVLVVGWPAKAKEMRGLNRKMEIKGLGRFIDDFLSANPNADLLLCGGFAEKLNSKVIQGLLEQKKTSLRVPGYVSPANEKADRPLIERVKDYILASSSMSKYYVRGSTRIEPNREVPPSAAVSFQVGPPEIPNIAPPSPPSPPVAPAAGERDGDF